VESEIRELLRDRAADVDLQPAIPPATVRRAQRRRVMNSVVALATTAALVVGAVVGVNALRRGVDEIPYVDQQIKPRQRVVIPVGGVPAEVTLGFGSAWVERQDEIVRVDTRTNTITARIVATSAPRSSQGGGTEVDHFYFGTYGLAAGEGAVWVTGTGGFTTFSGSASPISVPGSITQVPAGGGRTEATFSMTAQSINSPSSPETTPTTRPPDPNGPQNWSLLRIDPRTNKIAEAASLSAFLPTAIATGEKSVWVGAGNDFNGRGTVYRFDAAGHPTRSIPTDGPITGIAVQNHYVWASMDVNRAGGRSVIKIDPRTNKVVKTIPLPGAIATQDLAAADGRIWATAVLEEGQSAVAQIDAATGTLLRLIPFERPVVRLVSVGSNGVWLSTQDDPRLYRLDPVLNEISGVLPLGGIPDDLASSGNSVWVIADPDGGGGPRSPAVIRFDI